jgi:hypothetical protein
VHLAIDASNLRAGGGLTHLAGFLAAANPAEYGISRVTAWAGRSTIEHLPKRDWLTPQHVPTLDASTIGRLLWQRITLPRLAPPATFCSLRAAWPPRRTGRW